MTIYSFVEILKLVLGLVKCNPAKHNRMRTSQNMKYLRSSATGTICCRYLTCLVYLSDLGLDLTAIGSVVRYLFLEQRFIVIEGMCVEL
jgi:hypothetical protein